MAGREGGEGVMGQSHSNSERQQTATYGGTDRDGPQHTLNFFSFELLFCFVSLVFLPDFLFHFYFPIIFVVSINFNFSLYNFVSLLDFVFVSFSLCKPILYCLFGQKLLTLRCKVWTHR